MKFDLLVSDYDGTLGYREKISVQDVEAIKKYVAKGGKFAVCSGRPFCSIKEICDRYDIEVLVAAYQGSKIEHVKTGEKIFCSGVSAKESEEIAAQFLKDGFGPVAFIDDVLYYQGYSLYAEFYFDLDQVPKKKVDDLCALIREKGVPVQKLVFRSDNQDVSLLRKKYAAQFPNTLINSGGDGLVEAVNPDCGKGGAVKRIAEYYNIPLDKVLTVGDYNNDMELVGGNWHGVAVGDGQEELKKIAKEVTVPFKEHPIKTLLEKYCL